MTSVLYFPRLKGFRHPREIIRNAVWAYYSFAMSAADVEDLLAERGVIVSRETIRFWVNQFGSYFAHRIKRDSLKPNYIWHLDEVVISIGGKKHWLWRVFMRMAMFWIFLFRHDVMKRRHVDFSRSLKLTTVSPACSKHASGLFAAHPQAIAFFVHQEFLTNEIHHQSI